MHRPGPTLPSLALLPILLACCAAAAALLALPCALAQGPGQAHALVRACPSLGDVVMGDGPWCCPAATPPQGVLYQLVGGVTPTCRSCDTYTFDDRVAGFTDCGDAYCCESSEYCSRGCTGRGCKPTRQCCSSVYCSSYPDRIRSRSAALFLRTPSCRLAADTSSAVNDSTGCTNAAAQCAWQASTSLYVCTCPLGCEVLPAAGDVVASSSSLLADGRRSFALSACPAGRYCPARLTDSVSLTSGPACPIGFACSLGSPSPNICPPGTLCISAELRQPEPCPETRYCPATWTVPDDADTWSQEQLQDRAAPLCPTGSFCAEGSSAPTICPVGHFCPAAVAAPQLPPPGRFAAREGMAEAEACPAGTYSPDTTVQRSECDNRCKGASFMWRSGQTSCELSGGLIAVIVCAVAVGVTILIILFSLRRKKQRAQAKVAAALRAAADEERAQAAKVAAERQLAAEKVAAAAHCAAMLQLRNEMVNRLSRDATLSTGVVASRSVDAAARFTSLVRRSVDAALVSCERSSALLSLMVCNPAVLSPPELFQYCSRAVSGAAAPALLPIAAAAAAAEGGSGATTSVEATDAVTVAALRQSSALIQRECEQFALAWLNSHTRALGSQLRRPVAATRLALLVPEEYAAAMGSEAAQHNEDAEAPVYAAEPTYAAVPRAPLYAHYAVATAPVTYSSLSPLPPSPHAPVASSIELQSPSAEGLPGCPPGGVAYANALAPYQTDPAPVLRVHPDASDSEGVPQPQPQLQPQPLPAAAVFCSACGNLRVGHARFCPRDGARFG